MIDEELFMRHYQEAVDAKERVDAEAQRIAEHIPDVAKDLRLHIQDMVKQRLAEEVDKKIAFYQQYIVNIREV